jgi:exopolyphosphatase/guanosine-5'-triphosphate,3'-diphosphate pyrophosphatase
VERSRLVVGLAGTITTLAALAAGLTRHDPSVTHHRMLTRAEVLHWFSRLARAPLEERRRMLIEPARAEVIVAGTAVVVTILRELDVPELLVSEADILDGLASSIR